MFSFLFSINIFCFLILFFHANICLSTLMLYQAECIVFQVTSFARLTRSCSDLLHHYTFCPNSPQLVLFFLSQQLSCYPGTHLNQFHQIKMLKIYFNKTPSSWSEFTPLHDNFKSILIYQVDLSRRRRSDPLCFESSCLQSKTYGGGFSLSHLLLNVTVSIVQNCIHLILCSLLSLFCQSKFPFFRIKCNV